MPRVQVYLPEDLYELMKLHGFSPSELLQKAIRERAKLDEIMAATEQYLADLAAELGEPTPEEAAAAQAWVSEILDGIPPQAKDRMKLVLDSGGVSRLAKHDQFARWMIRDLGRRGDWPPVVPSVVLVECLSGRPNRDARTNQFLKTCRVTEELPTHLARRAATLRHAAGRGSAVDAIVVAIAEPAGLVLTSDPDDLTALAEGTNVIVRGI